MKFTISALALAAALCATQASAQFAVEGSLGYALDDVIDWEWGSYDYDWAIDGGISFSLATYYTGIEGWEFGLDVSTNKRQYTYDEDDYQANLFAMLNARKLFKIDEKMTGYVGLGLGAAWTKYSYEEPGDYYGSTPDKEFAGMISAGVRYALPTGSVFTEIKYVEAFEDAYYPQWDETSEVSNTTINVGYRYDF